MFCTRSSGELCDGCLCWQSGDQVKPGTGPAAELTLQQGGEILHLSLGMRKDAELSFTFNPAQLQVSVTKTAPISNVTVIPPRCQQSGPSVPGRSRLPASSWATASRVLGGAGLFTPALSAATPVLPQPRTAARLPSHLSCEVRRSIQPAWPRPPPGPEEWAVGSRPWRDRLWAARY